jgi:ubiquinone/menaquinone biosynthesis C-methylase UbiE
MKDNEGPVTWKEIWERKGDVVSDDIELKDLIAIDGFDTGAGEFSVDSWLSLVEEIKLELDINGSHRVLEVGCGAGAFLLPISISGANVYGIDYSNPHIQLCKKIMKSGIFRTSEARNIPFEDSFFDAVISNSVFQYFPNLEYAEKVVCEIARVSKKHGRVALLDINDASKKDEYELIRRSALGDDEYDRLYGSLSHQFYEKEWFERIAINLDLKCEVRDQDIVGYKNSKLRYNVFLKKFG